MKDIKNSSTTELIKQLTELEKQIDYYLLIYNRIAKELYYRVPTLDRKEEPKLKMLIKEKLDL